MEEIKNVCIKTKEDESSRRLIKLEYDHQHYSLYSLKISPLQGNKNKKTTPAHNPSPRLTTLPEAVG